MQKAAEQWGRCDRYRYQLGSGERCRSERARLRHPAFVVFDGFVNFLERPTRASNSISPPILSPTPSAGSIPMPNIIFRAPPCEATPHIQIDGRSLSLPGRPLSPVATASARSPRHRSPPLPPVRSPSTPAQHPRSSRLVGAYPPCGQWRVRRHQHALSGHRSGRHCGWVKGLRHHRVPPRKGSRLHRSHQCSPSHPQSGTGRHQRHPQCLCHHDGKP